MFALNFLHIVLVFEWLIGTNCYVQQRNFGAWSTDFFPYSLRNPIRTYYRQISNGSPPEPYVRAKRAMQLPLLEDMELLTQQIMSDIKDGLQYIFQTRNDWTFPLHGTATTAMQAVLDNMIEPGDKVLVACNGMWGETMANISEYRLDANVIRFRKPLGTRFSLDEIRSAVRKYKPKILAITTGESSTGVFQPLDGMGELCRREGCFLLVDSTSHVGMQPLQMDELKIDLAFASSNKGLGGVAGLAPVSISSRAAEVIRNRSRQPRGFQTDLHQQSEMWNGTRKYQSLSVPLMYSLREALAYIADEGKENGFERHANATWQLHTGLEALGVTHFVKNPQERMVGITTFNIPPGKDVYKIADYVFNRHNILISTGIGQLSGRVIRIATFGSNADPSKVQNIIAAMKNALESEETNS